MDLVTPILTQGVLGVAVVTLSIVVRHMWKKIERLEQEKVGVLEAWLKYVQDEKDSGLDIIKNSTQSNYYLADKIKQAKLAAGERSTE